MKHLAKYQNQRYRRTFNGGVKNDPHVQTDCKTANGRSA